MIMPASAEAEAEPLRGRPSIARETLLDLLRGERIPLEQPLDQQRYLSPPLHHDPARSRELLIQQPERLLLDSIEQRLAVPNRLILEADRPELAHPELRHHPPRERGRTLDVVRSPGRARPRVIYLGDLTAAPHADL